ncbi:MAG: F0F1 ATP synthase subunit delta [Rickettsia endosymbiont of Bryobia graminum]|nr:F0F1 ATP synthase subunit delta [Rickettsia endosymbiont of Bryobia graminum]
MIDTRLIRNYSLALFENVDNDLLADKILEQVKIIDELIQKNQEIKNILYSPVVEYNDKLQIIELITKNLNIESIVKQFLVLLLKNSRMSALSSVMVYYQELLNKDRNIKMVRITSSKKLQDEEQKWLQKYLEESLEQKVIINFNLDKLLIGGLIIEYDSILLDYSITGVLKKLQI